MSAATDALEELNELLAIEASKRGVRVDKSTELERAIREIRNFTESVAATLNRPEPELQVLPLDVSGLQTAATPEVVEILKEMRRLSGAAVEILGRPTNGGSLGVQPSPIVNVAAPSVSVTPSIRIEQPARRWRFTVTQRDNTAQMRIKEIIVESLE